VPHVTLAHRDLNGDDVGEVVRYLNGREWDWTVRVDNLALLYDRGSTHELLFKIPLGG
jgi:2'-5' RNA ligase